MSDVTPAEPALQREDTRHHFGLAVGIAKEGLRALLILNGGAAVALIALAGSDKQIKFDISTLGERVVLFGIGAFMAAGACLTGYLSQLYYANSVHHGDTSEGPVAHWRHRILNGITLSLVVSRRRRLWALAPGVAVGAMTLRAVTLVGSVSSVSYGAA
jgi:hypothetical protein